MSRELSARDAALDSFESRVIAASRQGLDSIECDSCSNSAQIIIKTTYSKTNRIMGAVRIMAQCENYQEPGKPKSGGTGCGNPRIMLT